MQEASWRMLLRIVMASTEVEAIITAITEVKVVAAGAGAAMVVAHRGTEMHLVSWVVGRTLSRIISMQTTTIGMMLGIG